MKCICGHHGNEHDPDVGWCMICDCKRYEKPDVHSTTDNPELAKEQGK